MNADVKNAYIYQFEGWNFLLLGRDDGIQAFMFPKRIINENGTPLSETTLELFNVNFDLNDE